MGEAIRGRLVAQRGAGPHRGFEYKRPLPKPPFEDTERALSLLEDWITSDPVASHKMKARAAELAELGRAEVAAARCRLLGEP